MKLTLVCFIALCLWLSSAAILEPSLTANQEIEELAEVFRESYHSFFLKYFNIEGSFLQDALNGIKRLTYPFNPECFGPIFVSHIERIWEIYNDSTIPYDEKFKLIHEEEEKAALEIVDNCELRKLADDMNELCKNGVCSPAWILIRIYSRLYPTYLLVTEIFSSLFRWKPTHRDVVEDLKTVSGDFAQLVRILIGKY
uniref:Uncharacterized protein n=1 Tax=Euplotes harpa TaxID=151035 RepID=A0A7S3J3M1_9SPIT